MSAAQLPLLSIAIWLPIIGGLWVIFAGRRVPDAPVRVDALGISIASFVASLALWRHFDYANGGLQLVERMPWIKPFGIEYYIGIDGKRHAYPNSKVFFTWYGNFDAVETITPAQLAAYPLGKNVRYRPGVRMVKFTTLNKVYVVARDGSLHWITSEAVVLK